MVSLARIQRGEKVLEVGTGKGVLTRELCRVASEVEGYEVDKGNFEETTATVGEENLRLHLADAFREAPKFDVLVSSLPYSESSSFIEWISRLPYDRAVVLLQEDFVEKIVSPPGRRDYRAVSVITQASTDVAMLSRVPRSAFSPQPKVGTVIVMLRPRRRLSQAEIEGIKRLFALRRRTVVAALGKLSPGVKGDWGRRRVYSLTPEEALELAPK
jgi:16S rRNA (adenine1518-N6/adenine1519-N6)-dimethyltransferase